MVSIDLKDAYLQIPIHPLSRKLLRFTAGGRAWQFKVFCFGLSTAPQVFTRVMVPVSSVLPQSAVRMLRYLDDWLILASSRNECCWARGKVLSLCQELGIAVLPRFILKIFSMFLNGYAPLVLSSLWVRLLLILNNFQYFLVGVLVFFVLPGRNQIPWDPLG